MSYYDYTTPVASFVVQHGSSAAQQDSPFPSWLCKAVGEDWEH